jgi:hypothetical protein
MRVESPAGKFILSFEHMDPGDGEIVITGRMGVWDAKTHMTLREFFGVLRMTLSPRMLGFLLKSLLTGGLRARAGSKEDS